MEPIWHILFAIQLHALFFTTDNLKNVYAVNYDSRIVKYDSAGVELYNYQSKANGEITSVDATNPLKILIYYKNFSTIVFLDNTLSEISRINLTTIGVLQPPVICSSTDGNFWVYDEADQRLKKFSTQLQLISESPSFSSLTDKEIHPQMMLEENQMIYVSDSTLGILVFDRLGNFSHKISLKGIRTFQIQIGNIFYQKDNSLYSYSENKLEESKMFSLPGNSIFVRFSNGLLYVLKQNSIDIYPY